MLAGECLNLFKVERKLTTFGIENSVDEAIARTLQGLHYHIQLVRLLDSWRLQWAGQTDQIMRCTVHSGTHANKTLIREFLMFLQHEAIIPVAVDLTAMFFLCSESNFIHHWLLWMHLQLRNKGANPALLQASLSRHYAIHFSRLEALLKCNPASLYSEIMALSLPTSPTNLFSELWIKTRRIRDQLKTAKNPCKCDADRQPHTCRRTINVERMPEGRRPRKGVALLEPWVYEMVMNLLRIYFLFIIPLEMGGCQAR